MKRLLHIVLLTGILSNSLLAQEINIDFNDKPLDEAIIEIRDSFDLYFSFNKDQLSNYLISIKGRFINIEEFLDEALQNLPFTYTSSGPVILIVPNAKKEPEPIEYNISGQIIDRFSGESLPFSHIKINNKGMITDVNGNFSFQSLKDSVFNLKISYLGYFIYDTAIIAGLNIKIGLSPSFIGLEEVSIEGREIYYKSQMGEKPGEVKLNHMVAKFLPGYGDNSVFNLLRLQPGIMAAGTNTSFLKIWGSYDWQNKVDFDGFTLFGLKNYNDQISSINPFMVKDIQILKGGYGSEYGDKSGSIVKIYGIEGNKLKPTFNLLINNLTINGFASVPIKKRSAISIAFRHTYYNLSKNDSINSGLTNRLLANNKISDVKILPEYTFKDMNLKYAGETKNGDNFHISTYFGADNFGYTSEYTRRLTYNTYTSNEKNTQQGVAAFFNKKWKGNNSAKISLSYSQMENNATKTHINYSKFTDRELKFSSNNDKNKLEEVSAKIENGLKLESNQLLKIGIGYRYTETTITDDTTGANKADKNSNIHNSYFYLNDNIELSSRSFLKIGLRANHPVYSERIFLQPRFTFNYKFSKYLNGSLAWGLYNQFVVKPLTIDNFGNLTYHWTVSDQKNIPIIKTEHRVANINFENKGFEINVDGYYKTSKGITRYIKFNKLKRTKQLTLDATNYGLDIYLKKDISKHSAWVSWSYGKSLEYNDTLNRITKTTRALYDQTYEIKIAGLINLNPVYLSANYVYGSGVIDPSTFVNNKTIKDIPYKRFDISVIYRFKSLKFKLESGISILNLFDYENISYNNLERIENNNESISIHTETVPFTPSIFLNIGF